MTELEYTQQELLKVKQLWETDRQKLDRFTRLAECGTSLGNEPDLREKLAECQLRSLQLRDALELLWDSEGSPDIDDLVFINAARELPKNDSALREAIAQAKREALLGAAEWFLKSDYFHHESYISQQLRRMAEEIT